MGAWTWSNNADRLVLVRRHTAVRWCSCLGVEVNLVFVNSKLASSRAVSGQGTVVSSQELACCGLAVASERLPAVLDRMHIHARAGSPPTRGFTCNASCLHSRFPARCKRTTSVRRRRRKQSADAAPPAVDSPQAPHEVPMAEGGAGAAMGSAEDGFEDDGHGMYVTVI